MTLVTDPHFDRATWLNHARAQLVVSQATLARWLGVSQSAVSYWETGERSVPDWVMRDVSRRLARLHAADPRAAEPCRMRRAAAYRNVGEFASHLVTCPRCLRAAFEALCADESPGRQDGRARPGRPEPLVRAGKHRLITDAQGARHNG